ncbi:Inositol hexakisphosphate and diphosphoinositol-pentakisphosphate kinase 1 [Wickerhamomyces ciferrii]|uniref:Inositol hexakisphosphate and diphosphoinositol-pentakisphosphate kinase n=1 Tax=Wickerhamomyces ciferrii (strain ATCC 14091 / BCRC 22168 / CBS 111 / JCM 3599 / NBRC 0793 / NRRL Y-1031 F-60-10) TaxID=1206466 RepID=K0KXA5_WICCF|nr:Inositol hexakisphosphate and diphosphoinositol-pentakisphosphate kinase 1 [Wickerhamomyces ciferrii]CCH46114.1 Inositol hexakisphosphate and diphosphoinositol-pentakisphosphate kinase 1 [Wickerhamomyces ciferrii]
MTKPIDIKVSEPKKKSSISTSGPISPLALSTNNSSSSVYDENKKAMASIAPILEGFTPKTSSSENNSQIHLPPPAVETNNSSSVSSRKSSHSISKVQLPKIGKIGVCAMDAKVLSKPCRQILNRLIENGEFETVIFGDKVILDESIENWPTCDFLISFFSTGFPLDKAIAYVKLRKPYIINDLVMQKALWDRRLCLWILDAAKVPTPKRLEISRDGGPRVDDELKQKLQDNGVSMEKIKEPEWKMIDEDTIWVNGETLTKPFVEKPVDGEDHNVYIYYAKKDGGGGRKLFRKVGNKSSEFDPKLSTPRTSGSYIYEQFMDTDNFEDVKAYTVGPNFCHAETRKSPVVDGIVRRNTHGKEIRYITPLSDKEKSIAKHVSKGFGQTICGFDLLRVGGHSYVIDVNGFSFVKDNAPYYDNCAKILRDMFAEAKKIRDVKKLATPSAATEEKSQKWVLKGLVSVIRHADRTPKQKFKYSFKSEIFISLLKGHKEEVIIREVSDLKIVLRAIKVAQEQQIEDLSKLELLANALEKKLEFPGTKIQLKPVLTEDGEVEKVQFILKWGGEATHSAHYQASDLGEQSRQDMGLLNKELLKNVKVFSSSERRVLLTANLWANSLLDDGTLDDNFINIRKDLLDDSNAAKDLMDKVKKKLKPLLREGKEAPSQFTWPQKMPEPYVVLKRVVELMNYHKQIMDHNSTHEDFANLQQEWCNGEDPELFIERWNKLFKEFITVEKVDPSKISELYDTMKFDALHNREFLEKIFKPVSEVERPSASLLIDEYPQHLKLFAKDKGTPNIPLHAHSYLFNEQIFKYLRELYKLSQVLFDFICPQEYGITQSEKLEIGLLTSVPLGKKIINDLNEMIENDKPGCVTYFTKESHMYTLLNILYESNIQFYINRNDLPELDYLSQIIFELYEDSSGKNHSIRFKLSPGCHTQDPLDVELDDKHYISCIPKISLTKHLDFDLVSQRLKSKFKKVNLPKKFTAVNISSPLTEPK